MDRKGVFQQVFFKKSVMQKVQSPRSEHVVTGVYFEEQRVQEYDKQSKLIFAGLEQEHSSPLIVWNAMNFSHLAPCTPRFVSQKFMKSVFDLCQANNIYLIMNLYELF